MTYTFKCETCDITKDFQMGTKNYHIPKCEVCKKKMQRVYFSNPIIFKGDFPGKTIKQEREKKGK